MANHVGKPSCGSETQNVVVNTCLTERCGCRFLSFLLIFWSIQNVGQSFQKVVVRGLSPWCHWNTHEWDLEWKARDQQSVFCHILNRVAAHSDNFFFYSSYCSLNWITLLLYWSMSLWFGFSTEGEKMIYFDKPRSALVLGRHFSELIQLTNLVETTCLNAELHFSLCRGLTGLNKSFSEPQSWSMSRDGSVCPEEQIRSLILSPFDKNK